MSEYVDIKSSPGEIIQVADGISRRGEELLDTVDAIRRDIASHEDRGETFPSDQFTDSFLQHYHQDVPGADGATVHANVAVQQSASYCGRKMIDIGVSVNKAMTNYEATDDESGDGIARTV